MLEVVSFNCQAALAGWIMETAGLELGAIIEVAKLHLSFSGVFLIF
jgi:hypothetical protein